MANPRVGHHLIAGLLLVSSMAACKSEEALVADPESRRTTTAGALVGAVGEYDNNVWLGIPYAQPPVGDLRWRAPQPPAQWYGTRQALTFGPPCTQYASTLGGVTSAAPGTPVGSEDCLYANVYAPRFPPDAVPSGDAQLPVMVWIHGGGNTIGEARFYNGGHLAVSGDVVVVTLNYRLGPFGWFRHAALRAGAANDLDRSGNFGTLDLIRGLDWVRENIAAFGGDPDNVTIFGESAGGQNVFSLLLSPPAKGLFHRAIVQSGGLWFSDTDKAENPTTHRLPEEAGSSNEAIARLMVADDLAADREAALARVKSMPPAELAKYLRAKSAFDVLLGYEPQPWSGMIQMPKVFRDGFVLPAGDPMQVLSTPGEHNDVPVMLGTTRDENKLFMFGDPRWVSRTLWIFWRLRDERMYNLTAEYLAKNWKAVGVDEPAAALLASQKSGVYAYRFDWDEEPTILGADLAVMLGASHGFEIPFVFGHFDLGKEGNRIYTAENEVGRKELAFKMMSYWAAFAHDGSPGRGRGGDLPPWSPWDNSTPEAMKFIVLDTVAGGGVRMSPDSVTSAGVVAAVAEDPRLATAKDQCGVLYALNKWSRALTDADYAARCGEYPADAYPWD